MPVRAIPLMLLLLAQADYARDAITLGKTPDGALFDAFNSGYQLSPAAPIESAEVITEFRRAVMLVRERAEQGQLAITERDVATAVTPYRGKVTFVVKLRFNPLNTYTKTPFYDLYVSTGRSSKPLGAEKLKRDPIFAGGPGSGLSGVRLEGSFTRADIESATAPMLTVTDEQANVLWQAHLDLSRFR
jgi:hypothetical protein